MPCAPHAVRAVADTNTVVSGLLWTGAPRALLIAARAGKLSLYTSATLLDELFDVLTRAKFTKRVTASNMSVERLVRRYAQFAQRVIPASIESFGSPYVDWIRVSVDSTDPNCLRSEPARRSIPPVRYSEIHGEPHG